MAIAGLNTPEAAIALLARAKYESGGAVEAFELMSRTSVAFAVKNIPGVREPLIPLQVLMASSIRSTPTPVTSLVSSACCQDIGT